MHTEIANLNRNKMTMICSKKRPQYKYSYNEGKYFSSYLLQTVLVLRMICLTQNSQNPY